MNMEEYKHKPSVDILNRADTQVVDEGLRQYMIRVFNYMGGGLIITALTAYAMVYFGLINYLYKIDYQAQVATFSLLGWIVALAPLAMIFGFGYVMRNKSVGAVQTMFWLFSALMGASLGSIFLLYTDTSLTRVFLITAGTFGAMSLYGYTTKRDLTSIGSFLFMGLIGLIIATLVNIFMQSETMYYVLSYIGVFIFTGLTAYDTQKIKNSYDYAQNEDDVMKYAISGALNLYLDFINLFLYLLRILGNRK